MVKQKKLFYEVSFHFVRSETQPAMKAIIVSDDAIEINSSIIFTLSDGNEIGFWHEYR